ncbi:MAG: hypothetical protein Q6365_008720, partial [Candidatus Sigynarchaeota archaeon]
GGRRVPDRRRLLPGVRQGMPAARALPAQVMLPAIQCRLQGLLYFFINHGAKLTYKSCEAIGALQLDEIEKSDSTIILGQIDVTKPEFGNALSAAARLIETGHVRRQIASISVGFGKHVHIDSDIKWVEGGKETRFTAIEQRVADIVADELKREEMELLICTGTSSDFTRTLSVINEYNQGKGQKPVKLLFVVSDDFEQMARAVSGTPHRVIPARFIDVFSRFRWWGIEPVELYPPTNSVAVPINDRGFMYEHAFLTYVILQMVRASKYDDAIACMKATFATASKHGYSIYASIVVPISEVLGMVAMQLQKQDVSARKYLDQIKELLPLLPSRDPAITPYIQEMKSVIRGLDEAFDSITPNTAIGTASSSIPQRKTSGGATCSVCHGLVNDGGYHCKSCGRDYCSIHAYVTERYTCKKCKAVATKHEAHEFEGSCTTFRSRDRSAEQCPRCHGKVRLAQVKGEGRPCYYEYCMSCDYLLFHGERSIAEILKPRMMFTPPPQELCGGHYKLTDAGHFVCLACLKEILSSPSVVSYDSIAPVVGETKDVEITRILKDCSRYDEIEGNVDHTNRRFIPRGARRPSFAKNPPNHAPRGY